MPPPPDTETNETDTEQSVVPDSLATHIPKEPSHEEKSKDPFFVYQRELAPGTKLEHYEIESVLGGGGFGITYLAKDILLNRHVVIKENFPSAYSHRDPLNGRIIPNNAHDLESYNWALRSFLNEARTIAELDHPGIAKILSIFESNGTAYFAMEFIDGFSLEYLGEQLLLAKKHYTEDELKGLLYRLLNILDYLHGQGIYHRDIKPGNILLNREGTPVLIDFGAARHANAVHSLTIMTTLGYSSPEQSLGLETVGPWSDIYSLGATFHALLTGTPPERGEVRINADTTTPLHTISQLVLIYSPRFLKSIDKALEPHVKDRYQSAREWIGTLQITPGSNQSTIRLSHQKGETVKSSPVSPPRQSTAAQTTTASRRKKNSLFRISLAMLLFMIFAGVLLSVVDFDKTSPLAQKLKENISSLEKNIHQLNAEPENLDSIPIPEIGIPLDSPSKPEMIDRFQLRLADSAMSSSNLPSPLPSSVRISAIYMMQMADGIHLEKEPEEPKEKNISLVIKDAENNLIATSDNQVPIAHIPGQIPICFTFPSLPSLNPSKTYTCTFINTEKNTPEKIKLSCLLFSLTPGNSRQYPLCRIICAPASEKTIAAKTKEGQRIFDLFSGKTPVTLDEITEITAEKNNIPFIRAMAENGYPAAQFGMSKIETPKLDKQDIVEKIIWLYKAAQGGFPAAQIELGTLLMGAHSNFTDIPDMPAIASRNYSQAAKFLRMTFQHKDPYSLYLLGMIYGQGWGIPKSPSTAAIFYNKATELDPSFQTKYLSEDNTILAYWEPRDLKPHEPLRIKSEIPLELVRRMNGIKLVGTGGLSKAIVSNIRLTWNGKTAASSPSPQTIVPGAAPDLIHLHLPETIMPSFASPVYLELEISTKGSNRGVIELETKK